MALSRVHEGRELVCRSGEFAVKPLRSKRALALA